jgi:hypothetical protein
MDAVRYRLGEMDAEGAARELALVLKLDRDAEELVTEIVREAFQAGRCQAHNDLNKEWSEEAYQ